jgi:hypothetical protein
VLGVFLGRTAQRQAEEQRLLRTEGVLADATVTRAWIDSSKERQSWVAYRFEYAGRIYSHRVETPRTIWSGISKGATIPVRVVPAQPSISHPIAWDMRPLPFWLAYVISGTIAASAFFVPIPVRRQMRLLAEGRPAPGHVTGFKKSDKYLVVKYEFRLLSGAIAKGKANTSKPPVDGATLCVLYDPENPRRNALYPLSLVRLENAPSPPRQKIQKNAMNCVSAPPVLSIGNLGKNTNGIRNR